MKRKFILRLPSKSKLPVYGQIFWVLIMLWLRDVLGLPSLILYFTDVITIYAFVFWKNRIKRNVQRAKMKTQTQIFIGMVVCMLIGVVINLVNPVLIAWAARNNLRFFAFFYICVGLLELQDVNSILGLLKKFFWINALLCTYQYFVLGLTDDLVGGSFGIVEGCNGYLNIFLCAVIAYMLAQYFVGRIKMRTLAVYLVVSLYIAVLAELKIFYFEFIVMFIVAVLCVRPSLKTVGLCLLGVLGIGLAIMLMAALSPSTLTLFFDQDALLYYISGNGYTNSGDLNRFTAIQQIYTYFFKDDPIRALFGFGFGNCETSQFAFLQSDFSKQYGYLHYRWFTHAWVYIEQGALGLILYVGFFVSLFVSAYRKKSSGNWHLTLTALIFMSVCIIGIIYNCVLQLEACYMMAFMCAIPYVLTKNLHAGKTTVK